ncbi:hypothetical protein PMI40_01555 [Herbaspirillum sp. YR522]|nr:hypothetical protein PMI40_01555 [Herbaspirillum sp. YR522]
MPSRLAAGRIGECAAAVETDEAGRAGTAFERQQQRDCGDRGGQTLHPCFFRSGGKRSSVIGDGVFASGGLAALTLAAGCKIDINDADKTKSGLSALQCDKNRFPGCFQCSTLPRRLHRGSRVGDVAWPLLLGRHHVARNHGADQQGVRQDVDEDVHDLLRKKKVICCVAIYAFARRPSNFESQYQLSIS